MFVFVFFLSSWCSSSELNGSSFQLTREYQLFVLHMCVNVENNNVSLFPLSSPVSIQTQSLSLRALRKRKLLLRNKIKRQPIGMLGRSSGNRDWLLANASVCVSCSFCSFRLRNAHNARNASDCVWMETGLQCIYQANSHISNNNNNNNNEEEKALQGVIYTVQTVSVTYL